MGRYAVAVLVCVALGSVTSNVVAWAIAWPAWPWYEIESVLTRIDHDTSAWVAHLPGRSMVEVTEEVAEPELRALWNQSIVVARTLTRLNPPADATKGGSGIYACGWPLRCLWAGVDYRAFSSNRLMAGDWAIERTAADPYDVVPHVLPLQPLWIGQVGNALVFGIVWLTLLGITVSVRCRWRVAHGRCAGCAYNLAGSTGDRCPECGFELE